MSKCRQCTVILACLLSLIGLSFAVSAQVPGLKPSNNWDLNGYVNTSSSGRFFNEGELLEQQVYQRFNFEYRVNSELRFNVGMRNRLFYGDGLAKPYYADLIAYDPGYWDLSHNWLESDDMVMNSQLDRLYLDWQKQDWQLRLGRFRIPWTMASIWNPNDIFNSYNIYEVNYPERSGSDAIQVARQLGFASSASLIYQPDKYSELNSYAGRYLFNYQRWDMQLLAGKAKLAQVLGAGFAGSIYGAGIRGELTWFLPTEKEWQGKSQGESTVSTLETDYRFSSQRNWYVRSAILHISEPQTIDNALIYLSLPLSARSLSFTRFTWYGDLAFDLSPLSRLTFLSSYYQDGSYFIGLSNYYSLTDNWQLSAILQRFDGSATSLFGQSASWLAYLQVQWSF